VAPGIKTACVTAKGGYTAELAIPVEQLRNSAMEPWKALQVFLNLYDFDQDDGDTGTYLHWQTDPNEPGGNPGLGAFVRR
jgi:hypothetical protein